jgi:hypothetical protein
MIEVFATLLGGVTLLNRILTTGILITAFALVIYIGLYNRRSHIARAYAGMLQCIMGVYLGDLLAQISSPPSYDWLRFQWIGIALMPATALGQSDALLRATGDVSPIRRNAVRASYFTGVIIFLLAAFTDLVAAPGDLTARLPHLNAGVLFYGFSLYYFSCIGWATYNVIEARRRSLTATSKRRLTYFTLSFLAPTLGVFPFLMVTGWPDFLTSAIPWLLILILNLAIGTAVFLMGYTVAYFGASAPDRVIKRRLLKYIIRGPVLAAAVVATQVLSGRIEKWLGLPGDFIGLIASATLILLTQLFIVIFQPAMDRLIAGEDAGEVTYLQQFSERLMTTSDLRLFLESIVAALCDLLRARTAFVMRIAGGEPAHNTPDDEPVLVALGTVEIKALGIQPETLRSVVMAHVGNGKAPSENGVEETRPVFEIEHDFILWDGYWLIPLRARETGEVIGVIGLAARASEPDLTDEERQGVAVLVSQAARALEDALKQQRAFEALERIIPEAEDMQRHIAETRNPAAPTVADFELAPEGYDDFTHLVRDALSQYWGGPRLANSPLIKLRVVTRAMDANNGNATKALRAVLTEAIERLKPVGTRSLTATEWLLYNILDMKILQGQRVRDVARKLVMSESDLYRKQRAAFEEVARIVADMEREERSKAEKDPDAEEETEIGD